jgi:prepilin-type N-terminal cleavage/methylation domain-containing protein
MKKNSGMTLIETIVAFAIIAVILVVAMMSINTIAGVNVKAQDMNTADEAMEERIASGTGYDDVTDKNLSFTITDQHGESIEITIPGRVLTYEHNGKMLQVFQLKK